MLSFSERLKAVVKDIDAAGSSLQARAIGQRDSNSQPQSPATAGATSTSSINRPASPGITSTKPVPSTSSPSSLQPITSPQRNGLAEGALSGLNGLRKSFNFPARSSAEHSRTPSTNQELRDIANPKIDRPSSPARFLGIATGNQFQLGSESSSKAPTPTIRPGRVASPIPTLDPDDPASFPLPPSPELRPTLEVLGNGYADPLGASPLLPPAREIEVPEVAEIGLDMPDAGIPDNRIAVEDDNVVQQDVKQGISVEAPQEEVPVDLEDAQRRLRGLRISTWYVPKLTMDRYHDGILSTCY